MDTNTKWYSCDTLKPDNMRDVMVADAFNSEVTLGYYDERNDMWIRSPALTISSSLNSVIQRPVAWCEIPRFDFVAYAALKTTKEFV